VLLLLTRFLAAALLLTRLLLAWVLLARILVLIAHSNSPFSYFAARVNAFNARRVARQDGLRGKPRFPGYLRGDSLSRLCQTELVRGTCARATNSVQAGLG